MKALLQRVKHASVSVAGLDIAKINSGLLVFLGIEKNDTDQQCEKMLEKILSYRIFPDEQGKMNRSVVEAQGGLLIVSQFTLVADTKKGLRPSFSNACAPEESKRLYQYFIERAKNKHHKVEMGQFGADMQVSLVNDGPVTFLLEV